MNRREFITLLSGTVAVWPVLARAQSTRNIPHIGILWHAAKPEQEEPYFSAIINGLRDVGYVDGSTVALEHRFPNEQPDQFRKMAAELVALQPDVLVGIGANASPCAARIAVLVDPADRTNTEPVVWEIEGAARANSVNLEIFKANDSQAIDTTFEAIAREHARPGRRGDRLTLANVRYWHKADIATRSINVPFRGRSGHCAVSVSDPERT